MQALSIYVHRKTSFISTDKIILKEEGPDIKTAFDNMFIYICKTKNIYINWLSNLHSPFYCSLIEVVTMQILSLFELRFLNTLHGCFLTIW